jgi:hypothetical protein
MGLQALLEGSATHQKRYPSVSLPAPSVESEETRTSMRILTAEAMREVDRSAIEGLGIPSLVLMENAALGVVDAIGEASGAIGAAESAAVFCGPGNNGGDGLAIARHLSVRGW